MPRADSEELGFELRRRPSSACMRRQMYIGQGKPQAKDSSGGGANWNQGVTSEPVSVNLASVESRLFFEGTVTASDMSRATDAREKGRIGITGSAQAYGGSNGRVTSEAIGRDVNPLGRGGGAPLVGGMMNIGMVAPRLPGSRGEMNHGNSVNNSCLGCGSGSPQNRPPGIIWPPGLGGDGSGGNGGDSDSGGGSFTPPTHGGGSGFDPNIPPNIGGNCCKEGAKHTTITTDDAVCGQAHADYLNQVGKCNPAEYTGTGEKFGSVVWWPSSKKDVYLGTTFPPPSYWTCKRISDPAYQVYHLQQCYNNCFHKATHLYDPSRQQGTAIPPCCYNFCLQCCNKVWALWPAYIVECCNKFPDEVDADDPNPKYGPEEPDWCQSLIQTQHQLEDEMDEETDCSFGKFDESWCPTWLGDKLNKWSDCEQCCAREHPRSIKDYTECVGYCDASMIAAENAFNACCS